MLESSFIKQVFNKDSVTRSRLIYEINTEKGKSVQDKTYPILRSQEEDVAKAINDLLKMKYIRNSKSTFINYESVKIPNGK